MTIPEHGTMVRDDRDEWPDEDPNTPGVQRTPGKFDIEMGGMQNYPDATARIEFICPNGQYCGVLIGPKSVTRPSAEKLCIWGWDGNMEKPTLTPSINCVAEKDGKPTGGCGWHGFIIKGVMK